MHQSFLSAGADLIETATFGAQSPMCWENIVSRTNTHRINQRAAEIAREEAAAFSTPDKPRFVIGSMGPGTKTISVTGGITFDQVADAYEAQALGLIEGGVDVLLLETMQDTVNVKAILTGVERAMKKTGRACRGLGAGHGRDDGHAAGRAGHRGILRLARAPRFTMDGTQLRDGSGSS